MVDGRQMGHNHEHPVEQGCGFVLVTEPWHIVWSRKTSRFHLQRVLSSMVEVSVRTLLHRKDQQTPRKVYKGGIKEQSQVGRTHAVFAGRGSGENSGGLYQQQGLKRPEDGLKSVYTVRRKKRISKEGIEAFL